jgi:hypothetical protein
MKPKRCARLMTALACLASAGSKLVADPDLVIAGGVLHVGSASDVLAATGGIGLSGASAILSIPSGFNLHSAPGDGIVDTVTFLDESATYRVRNVPQNQTATFHVATLLNASTTEGTVEVTRHATGIADISLRLLARAATQDGLTGLPLRWHLDSSNTSATDQHSLSLAWDSVLEPTALPAKALFASHDGTTWNGLLGSVVNEPARSLALSTFTGSLAARQFVIASGTPPDVANDTIDRQPEQRIKIHTGILLANDFNGGAALSVTGVSASSSQGGLVSLSGGWVFYTPPAGLDDLIQDSFTYTISNGLGSDSGTAFLIVPAPANNQAGNLTEVGDNPGGGKVPRFACVPGRTYRIYAKTELTDPWPQSPTMTAVADSRGRLSVTDPDATGPSRFYRLVMVR